TSVMVEMLLGVDEKTIREDYLFTNKTNKAKAEKIYRKVFEETGSEEVAASVYKAFIADEKYLDAALNNMGENFFEKKLKLDPKKIEKFKERNLI
ncbi:MAG: tyrosine-protein phosphatase, partial [Erysipelotrichaceae bacterium]|nr:tyrosine-protein phosphatase [Erysipelotrichaceae bacterium]